MARKSWSAATVPRRWLRWPGTARARCWRSPRRMATPACCRCRRRSRPPGEQCVLMIVEFPGHISGEYDGSGRQETRFGQGFLSRLVVGGDWTCLVQRFADRTRQEQRPGRSSDATLAILSACRAERRACRVEARRRASDHAGARTGPARCRGADEWSTPGVAASSGRKDGTADSAKIVLARFVRARACARTRNPEIGLLSLPTSRFRVWPFGPSRNDGCDGSKTDGLLT